MDVFRRAAELYPWFEAGCSALRGSEGVVLLAGRSALRSLSLYVLGSLLVAGRSALPVLLEAADEEKRCMAVSYGQRLELHTASMHVTGTT